MYVCCRAKFTAYESQQRFFRHSYTVCVHRIYHFGRNYSFLGEKEDTSKYSPMEWKVLELPQDPRLFFEEARSSVSNEIRRCHVRLSSLRSKASRRRAEDICAFAAAEERSRSSIATRLVREREIRMRLTAGEQSHSPRDDVVVNEDYSRPFAPWISSASSFPPRRSDLSARVASRCCHRVLRLRGTSMICWRDVPTKA